MRGNKIKDFSGRGCFDGEYCELLFMERYEPPY